MQNLSQSQSIAVHVYLQHPRPPASMQEVLAFEQDLVRTFQVAEAVAVSSGTAAIHCALAAHGIGPGDEVLVPALSVIMSSVPVLYQGAHPVFVDSAPGRVDFDYDDLRRKLSPRTKAVLPVHMWGCAYAMPRLMQFAEQHHLVVIEDACQAHGSTFAERSLGTWGSIGCFSMNGKLLSTGGGGFLLTNDHTLARTCRDLRSHFANPVHLAHSYQQLGYNYRLPELLALLGQVQLDQFEQILAHRRWQSEYLLQGIAEISQVETYGYNPLERSNLFSPIILLRDRFATRRVAEELARRGVPNSVGSFGLKPAQEWGVFQQAQTQMPFSSPVGSTTPHTTDFLARALAISLLPHFAQQDLERILATIQQTVEEFADGRSITPTI